MESWDKQLEPIIAEFRDGDLEPLTEVDINTLTFIIKSKIMLSEGLINEEAYENRLNNLHK